MLDLLLGKIDQKRDEINSWLSKLIEKYPPVLYSSVDIRDSGFKAAIVDNNFFPAGFNNLDANALNYSALHLDGFLKKNYPGAKKILLLAEENTRNTFYLENVRVIASLLQLNNYHVIISTVNELEEIPKSELLITSTQKEIQVFSPNYIIEKLQSKKMDIDLILLNNDLMKGIDPRFLEFNIPIVPSFEGGWHSRRKSTHFQYINEFNEELSEILQVDSWLLSTYFEGAYTIDVNKEDDRKRLYDMAKNIFKKIELKYEQYKIQEKPTLFMKADFGTYGMGIVSFENPEEILELNRKKKNKLYAGKGSVPVMCYLLQEGVPTKYVKDNKSAEPCSYFVGGNYCGSFFRMHPEKNKFENLNSKGASFTPISITQSSNQRDAIYSKTLELYSILAQISNIASVKELQDLKLGIKNELCLPR